MLFRSPYYSDDDTSDDNGDDKPDIEELLRQQRSKRRADAERDWNKATAKTIKKREERKSDYQLELDSLKKTVDDLKDRMGLYTYKNGKKEYLLPELMSKMQAMISKRFAKSKKVRSYGLHKLAIDSIGFFYYEYGPAYKGSKENQKWLDEIQTGEITSPSGKVEKIVPEENIRSAKIGRAHV